MWTAERSDAGSALGVAKELQVALVVELGERRQPVHAHVAAVTAETAQRHTTTTHAMRCTHTDMHTSGDRAHENRGRNALRVHQHGREDGELVDEEEIRLVHRRFGRVLTQYQHRAGVADASLDQAVQLVRVVLQVMITHEASAASVVRRHTSLVAADALPGRRRSHAGL